MTNQVMQLERGQGGKTHTHTHTFTHSYTQLLLETELNCSMVTLNSQIPTVQNG